MCICSCITPKPKVQTGDITNYGEFGPVSQVGDGTSSVFLPHSEGFTEKVSISCFPSIILLFSSVGPAAQRQVQNGPSPDEMEAQRR